MKTHPGSEEWMSFLYGEEPPARHVELNAHLRQCPECRQHVAQWRGGMTALDAWPVVHAAVPRQTTASAWRWAAAAALVLGAGIVVGRMTSPGQAQLERFESSLRAELESRLEVAKQQRETDREFYVAALKSLEEHRVSEYAALRKDLDTVAVNADDGLSRAQEQLIELATLTQPAATGQTTPTFP
jgi:hypothetical protein